MAPFTTSHAPGAACTAEPSPFTQPLADVPSNNNFQCAAVSFLVKALSFWLKAAVTATPISKVKNNFLMVFYWSDQK
jgi:hypothetical protein